MRQGWVIDLGKANVAAKTRLSQTLDMVQYGMDIETFPLSWRGIGEGLHPIDEFDDPVGFVADQPGERPILVADARFEQLGGAANAGKRILDLVGEHQPQRSDGAGGAAV